MIAIKEPKKYIEKLISYDIKELINKKIIWYNIYINSNGIIEFSTCFNVFKSDMDDVRDFSPLNKIYIKYNYGDKFLKVFFDGYKSRSSNKRTNMQLLDIYFLEENILKILKKEIKKEIKK